VELRLEFAGTDDVPRSAFHLTEQDGRYLLPRLVLEASGDAWVDDAQIESCEVPPGAEPLRAALLAAWGGNGPSGHGTHMSSPQCWLAAEHVSEPVEVSVTWSVTWYDTGLYERFVNSAEPFREESTVTMSFEPEPATAPPPEGQQDSAWGHRGHVAVDFGTSYCTATLFEQQYLPPPRPLSTMQASELRTEVTELLSHGPQSGTGARREFTEFVAEIAASLLPDTGSSSDAELLTALRRALTEDSDDNPQLLYAVLLDLERRVPQSSEALRSALAVALNDIYSRAWKVPPLDRLRLFKVMLDVNEEYVMESKATATLTPGLTVQLGRGADEDDADGPQTHIYAGLKQRLSNAEPHPELGAGVTSDDLIREALRDIVGRCNTFVEQGSRELGTGRVNNVVITFPTMATPPVRQKLRDMLEKIGIRLVDNTLDEAIAAAMFTVLRDFGSDFDTGLELLRSQSRGIGTEQDQDEQKKWQQNLLVIDIGGGTTDIALLGLHLHDETPEEALQTPGRHGRYYVLIPEVLGSTGRLQLGGELMSLRVFYWIKALLGDQLLRRFPKAFERPMAELRQILRAEPGDHPLLTQTRKDKLPAFDRGGGTSSSDAFDVLDKVVPTRSAPGYGRPSQAFWLLWRIADKVKLDFCAPQAPQEISLRPAEVRRMLQVAWSAAGVTAPDVQEVQDSDLAITLTKQDFERLVTQDIDEIMELAYRLAANRLSGSEDSAEPVDRIILTGQASRAPLVRSRLLTVFGNHASDPMAVSWQPKSVSVVEGQFAKLATSLGACWTKSNKGLVASAKGAIPQLREGRNAFRINVDNLFFNLPCTFLRGTQHGSSDDALEILLIGKEMFQAYPDRDVAVLRSDPFELTGTVAIYREAQGTRPRWADFQWEIMESQDKLSLDKSIWPSAITAQLEATSNLDLSLLLSRGQPHYETNGSAISVLDAVTAADGSGAAERTRFWQRSGQGTADTKGETKREFDPSRIVVNAFSGDGNHKGTPIFARPDADEAEDAQAGDAQPGDAQAADAVFDAKTVFAETFHIRDGQDQETVVRGAVSKPLDDPPLSGAWVFHYRDDEDGLHQIGELTPPGRTGQLAVRYHASVDEQGNLRVHAGEVPYWAATSLADVQDRPGSVYHADMVSTSDDYEPERDPFNGSH
jgi:molecular chaperone DnaK (HSP70)